MSETGPKFTQKETVDKPGIVGARWWQESIATEVPRRKAITGLIALGGALAGVAAVGLIISKSRSSSSSGSDGSLSPSDYEIQPRSSLDMQKEFGWNFGATDEQLVFDGTTTQPFDRAALETLATDLSPSNAAYTPYWIPTLFQAPTAMPKSKPTGDPDAIAFKPLKDVVVPVSTPEMVTAFGRGKALAAVLSAQPSKIKDLGVVIDLPGPEAVAFAAGMAGNFDPVFLFDNWPHPRGVVPAHKTLAAALYYQPLFAKAKSSTKLPPMLVLDRTRLASYVDDASQFDNRYAAKMPTTANLKSMGVAKILYVGPNGIDRFELDDLVDDFLAYGQAGAIFRVVPQTAFTSPTNSEPFFYGGTTATNATFWAHWDQPADRTSDEVQAYTPRARATPYSSGVATPSASTPARVRPTGFGMTPVVVALGTGIILGSRTSRSGSWNRTTYPSTSS